MLEVILGTKSRELTLQFLITYKNGYAREIAKYFEISLPSIQNQLNTVNFAKLKSPLQSQHKPAFA